MNRINDINVIRDKKKFNAWKNRYDLTDDELKKIIDEYYNGQKCCACERYYETSWRKLTKCIDVVSRFQGGLYTHEFVGFVCRGCSYSD